MKSKEEEKKRKEKGKGPVYFSTTDEVGLPVVWAGVWQENLWGNACVVFGDLRSYPHTNSFYKNAGQFTNDRDI